MLRALLALVATTTLAYADDAVPLPPPDPAHGPGFVILDRQDGTSRAGVDVTYLSLNILGSGQNGNPTLTSFMIEPHAQYVDPGTGAGGYAQLPISRISGNGTQINATGDVEVGALYAPHFAPEYTAVIHAGIALPTAPTDDNGVLTNVFAFPARVQDFVLAIPSGTSIRVGASPLLRAGSVYVRVVLGADFNVSNKSANNGPSTDIKPVYHLGGGAGFDTGIVVLSGELVAARLDTSGGTGSNPQWFVTGALAARYSRGAIRPYAALIVPINNNVNDFIHYGVTLGVDAMLR
jgi:hypothetical protein